MKHLLCLLGSPRRGRNSDTLAQRVCQAFEEAGGASEQLALNKLTLRPCTGCNWCQREHEHPCVLDDDMQQVYDRMLAADALLWATPVYSWAPTVEVKIVLDRQYAWGDYQPTSHARALAGRPVGLAVTYGDPDPATNGFFHCYHILRVVAEASGGRFAGCAHGPSSAKGGILGCTEALAAATALGHKLYALANEGEPGALP